MSDTSHTTLPELATSGRQKINLTAVGDPHPKALAKALGEHLLKAGYLVYGQLNCYPGPFQQCKWDAYDDPDFVEVNHESRTALFFHL